MINGNMIGIGSAPLKTVILTDESGNEITGVVTGSEVVFTATDNDVREGMVYASDEGVSTGTKEIPAYVTAEGYRVITAGSDFVLPHVDYDYTKIQAMFCVYNTNRDNSVATDKVVIDNSVYNVSSTDVVSTITKDHDIGQILFGITNNTSNIYLIRYFMFKEVY